ncbi:MAG: hypothetical protein WCI01_05470 [Chlorobiaceae bacterium]
MAIFIDEPLKPKATSAVKAQRSTKNATEEEATCRFFLIAKNLEIRSARKTPETANKTIQTKTISNK